MRILIVSHTYCEWNSRAKWRHIVMENAETELKIITPYYWPDVLSKVESKYEVIKRDNRVIYEVIPSKAYFLGHEIYHFYPGLARVIRDFKPDVIQVETGSNSLSLFQALLIKIFYRMHFRVIFFSWINWKAKFGWKYRYFYQWIEIFNLKRVSGGVLGNRGALDIFKQDKNFLKKGTIIPQLGTDLSTFCPASLDEKTVARVKFKLPCDKLIVGFAGRITKEKGILNLLEACKSLNVVLVIAGDGDFLDKVKKHVSASYQSVLKVIFLGALSHSEMPQFFKALDIFILPSYDTVEWKEQFGQVLIQAMASKVPVIGSNAGEIPNVIGDAGLIFRQKDVQSLNKCLIKLISSVELRKKLSEQGYKRAVEYYSHEAIAKETYRFWDSINLNEEDE